MGACEKQMEGQTEAFLRYSRILRGTNGSLNFHITQGCAMREPLMELGSNGVYRRSSGGPQCQGEPRRGCWSLESYQGPPCSEIRN